MSDRRHARLGELFERDNRRLGAHDREPAILSLSKHEGFVHASDYFGKRIASEQLDGYKVVDPGGWAYSTIHIEEGSIACNATGVTGAISPMYTTMSWASDSDDPRYVEELLKQPSMLAIYRSRSRGTVNRRMSLNWDAFASIEVDLPSLDVQHRVVDITRALDASIASLDTETADLATALEATLDLSFPITSGGTRPLDELVTARSGPSWAATEETSQPVEGATPVVKITNTRPDGSFDTSQLAYVRGLPASTTTLNGSSIVVIRTNGNRARIGNAYLPPADVFGAAVSAFQFHVEATEPATRDYVYWFLRAPKTQAAMSAAASGTTGLGNLALKTLRALEVPWPDEPIRDGACATLRQLQDAVGCLQAEAEALRGVRAAILPALLSGHLEVPESYDELVGAL